MSLTSYRAAPSRDRARIETKLRSTPSKPNEPPFGLLDANLQAARTCKWVLEIALAAKPGGDLLFHRLSDSTIGAVRFHGRVRDGIGWVTDAMTTKL